MRYQISRHLFGPFAPSVLIYTFSGFVKYQTTFSNLGIECHGKFFGRCERMLNSLPSGYSCVGGFSIFDAVEDIFTSAIAALTCQ